MRKANDARRAGFTLIELLVVIAILALLVSLILVASADGVRRAEERATQALITKLETALNDRLDALLNTQPPINQTHRYLASVNVSNGTTYFPVGSTTSNSDDRRAAVIAQFDYLRAELPDVFFLNSGASDGSTVASAYPLNFAAAPYPAGTKSLANPVTGNQDGGSWLLPLGNAIKGLPTNAAGQLTITSNPDGTPAIAPSGMFGASFSAAASVYKNLYTAAASDLTTHNSNCSVNFTPGLDGVDNNGDGLIDELVSPSASTAEVVVTGSPAQSFASYVAARLAKHTHKTARAEVLYAILVEGLSPLGSIFSSDDFTAREVQDTDGDGMPEFIDAWGEPLQFFRWPVYYGGPPTYGATSTPIVMGTSDSQRGYRQYGGASQTREQDPLDPNQLLVAPGWWSGVANASLAFPSQLNNITFSPPNANASPSTNQSSPGAIAFMNYFHTLVDPYPGSNLGAGWDRGNRFTRRAYFTKFLLLSAGPDHEPGVAQFAKDYGALVDSGGFSLPSSSYQFTFPNGTMEQNALALISIENQAAVLDPVHRAGTGSGSFFEVPDNGNPSGGKYTTVTPYLAGTANSDDITNHNISGISTGVR